MRTIGFVEKELWTKRDEFYGRIQVSSARDLVQNVEHIEADIANWSDFDSFDLYMGRYLS